jgi:transposase InsO family protein
LIVEDGWPVTAAAKLFMVSPVTARKWAARFRVEGPDGMADRSSRPRSMPARTPEPMVRAIVQLLRRHRLGPVQIGGRLGLAPSSAHAVLTRSRLNRLSVIDRVSGEPIRRYEHPYPGSLIHVDVTKFANIPDGGGHRYVGRQQGQRNQFATPGLPKGADYKPRTGTSFLHTVIDDHFRVAYLDVGTDEKGTTAAAVLRRAVAWFAQRGVRVERVLLDNGSCYRSEVWKQACADLKIMPRRTRPVDALLQSPPHPLRHRRHTSQQAQQPAWTSQLGAARQPRNVLFRH